MDIFCGGNAAKNLCTFCFAFAKQNCSKLKRTKKKDFCSQMRFEKKRLEARRRYLGHLDIVDCRYVPDFIIEAFFGESTYKKRLVVSTFAYTNGINMHNLLRMIKWTGDTTQALRKIQDLIENYFTKEEYRKKYYSYNVNRRCVIFLDGKLCWYGQRVENS